MVSALAVTTVGGAEEAPSGKGLKERFGMVRRGPGAGAWMPRRAGRGALGSGGSSTLSGVSSKTVAGVDVDGVRAPLVLSLRRRLAAAAVEATGTDERGSSRGGSDVGVTLEVEGLKFSQMGTPSTLVGVSTSGWTDPA